MAERPANVPEKFWNAETESVDTDNLLKSYSDMHSEYSRMKQTSAPSAPIQAPAMPGFEDFTNQYVQNQGVTDSMRQSLNGMPEDWVRGYEQMITELATTSQRLHTINLHNKVGGEEKLNELMQWAGDNLEQTEIDKFNVALTNPDQYEMALDSLITKSGMTTGSSPTGPIGGDRSSGGVSGNAEPFADRQAMADAMRVRDDNGRIRYQYDAAYREEVRQRVANSPNI